MRKIIIDKTQRRQLIQKRQRLLKKIAEVGPIVMGSISHLHRICGAKNCGCKKGGKKHEAFYLTWKEDKKTKSLYIPVSMYKETIQWVNNHKKLKALIKELAGVQQDILLLR